MSPFPDINPRINEIWLCKSSFIDRMGISLVGKGDYMVCIVSETDEIYNERVVRIQPVSKQIKYRTTEDIYVKDSSIIGEPFIIETWNEQPILIDILDKKIGKIAKDFTDAKVPEDYTPEQLEFRKSEIRNTAYLRQSVLSSLQYNESNSSGKLIRLNPVRIVLLAASVLGFIFVLWQPTKLSNEQFFQKYSDNYTPSIEYMNGSDQILRGSSAILEGFSSNESEIIQLAMKNFAAENFEGTLKLLKSIQDLDDRNQLLYFTYGISQLNTGFIEESISTFEDLLLAKELEFHADVQYYLAMADIRIGNNRKARKILKNYDITSEKSPEVQKMLKDLRFF
jgi:tetratricopeptide (TPR) repeat protein